MHRIKILFQNIFTVQFKRQKQILKGFGYYKHDILDKVKFKETDFEL